MISDAVAGEIAGAVLALAVSIRDDGPDYVTAAAQAVLDAAGGDPIAALATAAALVPVDAPIRRWWLEGLDAVGDRTVKVAPVKPKGPPRPPRANAARCGTRSGWQKHRRHGETPCDDCVVAMRTYSRESKKRRAQAEASAVAS